MLRQCIHWLITELFIQIGSSTLCPPMIWLLFMSKFECSVLGRGSFDVASSEAVTSLFDN